MLIQYYKNYKETSICEPPEVIAATREYQKMSDIYAEFKDDCIVSDATSAIKCEDVYNRFKIWFRINNDGKCPTRVYFKDNIVKHLGKLNTKNLWNGWRIADPVTGLEDLHGGGKVTPSRKLQNLVLNGVTAAVSDNVAAVAAPVTTAAASSAPTVDTNHASVASTSAAKKLLSPMLKTPMPALKIHAQKNLDEKQTKNIVAFCQTTPVKTNNVFE
jgi:phage/plasmid-associated DNA primase